MFRPCHNKLSMNNYVCITSLDYTPYCIVNLSLEASLSPSNYVHPLSVEDPYASSLRRRNWVGLGSKNMSCFTACD